MMEAINNNKAAQTSILQMKIIYLTVTEVILNEVEILLNAYVNISQS